MKEIAPIQNVPKAVASLKSRLALATTPTDIAAVETAATALQDLAQRARLSRDEQNRVGEIILEAARKGGGMLAEMGASHQRARKGRPKINVRGSNIYPTLVELGLGETSGAAQQRALRWSLINRVPEHLYLGFIDSVLESRDDSVLTIGAAIVYFKQWKREQDITEQRKAIAAGEFTVGAGPYDVIVYDPPWPYGNQESYHPEHRRATTPYPEMSLEEIATDGDDQIVAKAVPDCILWLWTTHKFMRHSFPLLDHWGFADKQIVTWAKQKMGVGTWLRSKSEFCIMAVRGSPKIHLTDQTTVINGITREHSRKPDEFYEMVESLCLGVRRYDRFGREQRETWDVGGNTPELFTASQ